MTRRKEPLPIETIERLASEASNEFDDLLRSRGDEFRKLVGPYRGEIGVKLRHLSYNVRRIRELLIERNKTDMSDDRYIGVTRELWFYTEAFYYFAWRTKKAFDVAPGLGSFSCDGVRNVRNQLLEHPENFENGLSQTGVFGIMSDTGPMIKHPAVDKGFAPNASEFYQNLLTKIRSV